MSVELGPVELLGAETIGQPGQRRFYLFARSRQGSAYMWVEKEQLNRLSLTLDRALAHLTEGQVLRTEAQVGSRVAPASKPTDFPRTPEYDFREVQIGLTYDEFNALFTCTITPIEVVMEPGEEPQAIIHEDQAVSFTFTHKQAQSLSSAISYFVSGGRPVCPLCHMPLDGGSHACVKQNGHSEIVRIVAEEEKDEEDEE
jgi:uncharacterized repeat protein (TIGR03847 family)